MHLSQAAMNLGQSATLRLNDIARCLKAEGKPIIHLGGGEPVEKIPQAAYDAALKKLKTRHIKYTPASGLAELKNEIISYTEKKYGFKVSGKNIIISGGAKQSIYNFLMAVVDPGSEVLFPAPYWVSYPDMVKLVYGTPVIIKPKKDSLLIDIDDMEKHITSNTRAVLLNSPNNPSGVVYGEDFIGKLVEICESKNIYLLTDDIYGRLVGGEVKTPFSFSFSKKSLDDSPIVSVNGVSKMYSMTGFRIGWSIANEAITMAMAKIQGQITSCPSDLSQTAAIGALRDGESFIKEINASLDEKRKDHFVIHVADQGLGIAEKDKAKIFSRFFRSDEVSTKGIQGTGLGLFIVKQLVEKMGGEIWFESKLGKGTTFSFSLPKAK